MSRPLTISSADVYVLQPQLLRPLISESRAFLSNCRVAAHDAHWLPGLAAVPLRPHQTA
jgi:hypothetical protein